MLNEILEDFYSQGRHDIIVNSIEELPEAEWNYDVKIHLGRAYNNTSKFEKAINVLLSEKKKGQDDKYWNFVIGYAYFHKNDYKTALEYFEKSFELGRLDVKDYILRSKQGIKNKGGYKIKAIADKYKDFGFNISCIGKKPNEYNKNARSYFKTPNHPWTMYFNSQQRISNYNMLDWNDSVGVGTFTSWNKLVVIDIDGCNDINFLKKILTELGLPENYEWVVESGSKNGYHIFYYGDKNNECGNDHVVSTYPPRKEYEKYLYKMEFLWRTHVVLPPSVHSSGNKYKFVNQTFPKNSPTSIDKSTISKFIKTFLDVKEVEVGDGYGEVFTLIKSNSEFVTDLETKDLTQHLLDDVYLIIDIETSGLTEMTTKGKKIPEIVQIAWLLINKKGTILKKHSYIIDTPYIVENNFSDIINIDFKVARKVKFSLRKTLKILAEDLKMSDYVVAHNIEFDIEILGHYFVETYGANPFNKKNKICTMKSTVDFCKLPNNYGYKYPKLSELYFKLFQYEIKNSHNAEVDVLNTLKCFNKLKKIGII